MFCRMWVLSKHCALTCMQGCSGRWQLFNSKRQNYPSIFRLMSGRIAWVPPAAGTCFGGEVRDAAELSLPGASNAIALGPCQFLGGANPPGERLGLHGDDTQLSPPMCLPGL